MGYKSYPELIESAKAAHALTERLLRTHTEPTPDEAAIISAGTKDAADAAALKQKIDRSRFVTEELDRIGGKSGGSGAGEHIGAGFKAAASASWAKSVAERMRTAMGGPDGAKALTSGSLSVPTIVGEPVEISGRPTSVLDLISRPSSPANGLGNGFSYLRQVTRTNNAAAVADGATKPTSVYSFGQVDAKFSIYAHLSEPMPLRYLTDLNGLTDILKDQMAAGLLEKLEQDLIAGTGTGDSFTGVLNTSGIQSQAFATDILTSMSNAKFRLISASQEPTAWVISPTDAQRLELLRESGSTGAFLFRNGLADAEKFLGAPIVMSTVMPAGTGLLGDWRTVELLVRDDAHLDLDLGGTNFTANLFTARVEGSYGVKVGRPLSFVKTALAA